MAIAQTGAQGTLMQEGTGIGGHGCAPLLSWARQRLLEKSCGVCAAAAALVRAMVARDGGGRGGRGVVVRSDLG